MSMQFRAPQAAQVGAIYTPYTPTPAQSAELPIPDAKTAYEGFMQLQARMPMEERLKLNESLAERLSDELQVTEFGRELVDRIHPEEHENASLQSNPFTHVGAGATIAVTATDPRSGEIFVLVGRKYKDKNRKELGLDDYILPGGYINAHPLEFGPARAYDNNLSETARRELREETGITLTPETKVESLGADSRFGISNDPREHTVNEFFHVPLLLPPPPRMLPVLTPGDDLPFATWIPARAILKDDGVGTQDFGSEKSRYVIATNEGPINLRDEHGEYLEKALLQARQSAATPQKQWVDRIGVPANNNNITR